MLFFLLFTLEITYWLYPKLTNFNSILNSCNTSLLLPWLPKHSLSFFYSWHGIGALGDRIGKRPHYYVVFRAWAVPTFLREFWHHLLQDSINLVIWWSFTYLFWQISILSLLKFYHLCLVFLVESRPSFNSAYTINSFLYLLVIQITSAVSWAVDLNRALGTWIKKFFPRISAIKSHYVRGWLYPGIETYTS